MRDGLTEQKGEALRSRSNMLGVRTGQVNGTQEIGVFRFSFEQHLRDRG
jgi:hypothetical protein